MRTRLFCLLWLGIMPALASPQPRLAIDIVSHETVRYRCEPGALRVHYYTARNGQSFALLSVGSRSLLFAQGMSASGVRYTAERYVWWTKGEQGDLYDETLGADAAPILRDCRRTGH